MHELLERRDAERYRHLEGRSDEVLPLPLGLVALRGRQLRLYQGGHDGLAPVALVDLMDGPDGAANNAGSTLEAFAVRVQNDGVDQTLKGPILDIEGFVDGLEGPEPTAVDALDAAVEQERQLVLG